MGRACKTVVVLADLPIGGDFSDWLLFYGRLFQNESIVVEIWHLEFLTFRIFGTHCAVLYNEKDNSEEYYCIVELSVVIENPTLKI